MVFAKRVWHFIVLLLLSLPSAIVLVLAVFAQNQEGSVFRPELILQNGIGAENFLDGVVFSPNGRWLATSDRVSGGIKIWDVDTGNEIRTLMNHREAVWGLAVDPDGRLLASAGSRTISIWESVTGRAVRELSISPTSGVNAVTFGMHGSWLAAASDSNTVKVWDVSNGHELFVASGYSSGVTSLAFSPDGHFLATGDIEHRIRLWNLATGNSTPLSGHTDAVRSLTFSPDGTMIASGSSDHSVRLWSVGDKKEIAAFVGHEH